MERVLVESQKKHIKGKDAWLIAEELEEETEKIEEIMDAIRVTGEYASAEEVSQKMREKLPQA